MVSDCAVQIKFTGMVTIFGFTPIRDWLFRECVERYANSTHNKGEAILPGTAQWEMYAPHFKIYPSTRQNILAAIHLVQTSCGFGVPLFNYVGDRDIHFDCAQKKGPAGLQEYVQEKNLQSLDGLPTDLGLKE